MKESEKKSEAFTPEGAKFFLLEAMLPCIILGAVLWLFFKVPPSDTVTACLAFYVILAIFGGTKSSGQGGSDGK